MQVTNHNRVWMPVAVFLLVFLVYGISLGNQFVWDDEESIVQNQLIHSLSNLPKFFTGGIFNSYGSGLTGGFYRPLTTTVMAVLWALSDDPWIFRLFQVSLHATAVVLLFFFLQRWFRLWPAFAGALVFAVHPGISEAVLWISTIADPLATALLLASLLLFSKHIESAALFFFLALLTKESSIAFLPVFFYPSYSGLQPEGAAKRIRGVYAGTNLSCFSILLPDNRGKQSPRSAALWLGTASALYALLRISAVGFGVSSLAFPSPIARADVARRLLSVPAEITYYVRTFLWPFPLSISRHFVITHPSDIQFWGSLIILVIGVVLLVKHRNRRTMVFTLWFALGLLPYLQFVPLSATVADRWLYLPSIGLIGLILIFLERLPKRVVTVICGTVVLVFSLLTIQRSLQWKNGLTLFTHDVSVNPGSFDLANNYGVELFRAGDTGAARKAFERSINLNPAWWVAYNNAGAVSERLGDTQKAEALYRTSMDRGSYYLAYENLAKLLLFKKEKPQEAKDVASRGLTAFRTSANLWLVYTVASYQTGNKNEAIAAARRLYALAPNDQTAAILSKITNNLPLEFINP